MGSFLTALANIGSQYAEGTTAGKAEKAATALQQQQQQYQQRYLEFEQKRLERESQQGKYIKVGLQGGGDILFEPETGKWIRPEEAMGHADPYAAVRPIIEKEKNPEVKQEMMGTVQAYSSLPAGYAQRYEHEMFGKILGLGEQSRKEQAKAAAAATTAATKGIPADLLAQFPLPDASDKDKYPLGDKDPAYQVDKKLWGANIDKLKRDNTEEINKMKAADWRGLTYHQFVDQEGNPKIGTWQDAERNGWYDANLYERAGSQMGRIADIQVSSYNMRNALTALQPGDAFTALTTAQLQAAVGNIDMALAGKYIPGAETLRTILENEARKYTNQRQQDYLVWIAQLQESAMAMTRLGAYGQRGAQDMRDAIRATIPGINAGSKQFALKYLDAFDLEVSNLARYVPRIPAPPPLSPYSPTGGTPGGTVVPRTSGAVDNEMAPQSSSPDVGPGKRTPPTNPNNPLGLTPPPGMQ